MKSLKQACIPRDSVFDKSRRDTVLDLTDLIDDRIDPQKFFEENYITEGMHQLLHGAFQRFEKKSDQGVYLLSQAMGGGKTHNMIALGLLARYPETRQKVPGLIGSQSLGKARVIGFTGRESDAPYGIWGALADQLGKKDVFKDYYSPLSAPGPSAWINLLKGEPLLILLDELSPYFENARAKTIGNTDLSVVTTTALSNLLVAINKAELDNVCVVISDLQATYEGGGNLVIQALSNLENEVNRSAVHLEPVGMNTDEVYHILRKRLFKELPDKTIIHAIAEAYAQAVKDAKQMDLTNASPDQYVRQITEAYPFHFAIRDLYARFRENPGFQQTRGLIRLMRVVVSRLYGSEMADKRYLIHPYDIDLNHRETVSEITAINPKLENAIAHDVASGGEAVAELMDKQLGGGTHTQDVAKLILISSLPNIPNAVLGLSKNDIVSYMCAPGRDVASLEQNIFSRFFTTAWYLHTSKDGKLFFKNVKNLVADLKTRAESYNRESTLKELRQYLKDIFESQMKDCYQEVNSLPALDEIDVKQEKVSLIIFWPHHSGGLHPDLARFYDDIAYKNRVLFLSGQKEGMDTLLIRSSEYRAIKSILLEMDDEKIAQNDPQRAQALDLQDQYRLQLLSACRETFTTLFYPHSQDLRKADFLMNFTGNEYKGEKQIRETLKNKQKFTEDIESDTFRKKCEQRLFTQKVMLWSEIKRRAGINTVWQWHHPQALDRLKEKLIHEDAWREDGSYVEKPPFPKPQTAVRVQELNRDDDTGEVTLRLTPVHGDRLHYELGSIATTASSQVDDPKAFKTSELNVSFLCVDSKGEHETGEAISRQNTITIKSRIYQQAQERMAEFQAAPSAEIRYTTDGSNPKNSGGVYTGTFPIPDGTRVILAVAEKNGIASELHRLDVPEKGQEFQIDPDVAATWSRTHNPQTTKDAYTFLHRLKKHEAKASEVRINIGGSHWLDLVCDPKLLLSGEKLETTVENLRELLPDGQVSVLAESLYFEKGQSLLDWVAEIKGELSPDEVQQ